VIGETVTVPIRFRDRPDAGRQLSALLVERDWVDPVVLALPRGGVPVAAEVARDLGAVLDVLVVRKVGVPWHPELAVGAIAEGGVEVVDELSLARLRISDAEFREVADRARAELARRVALYRGDRALPPLEGRDAIVIDDGLATGLTAQAAVQAVRRLGAARVVMAAPVCAADTPARLEQADEVVCVRTPYDFRAVGLWYDEFGQTSDAEVLALLGRTHGG
jgi:predicted phosphoribosyltransferase